MTAKYLNFWSLTLCFFLFKFEKLKQGTFEQLTVAATKASI